MIRAVVLDSGPLSLLAQRQGRSATADAARDWAVGLRRRRVTVYVPEIADYEVRRELVRAGKTLGVARLDSMQALAHYLPLTTEAMVLAADLWAQARNAGLPTADSEELDVDAILAAQALTLGLARGDLVIATTNPGHLSRFAPAELWESVRP